MSEFRDKVHLDASVVRETEMALLCDIGNEQPVWIPKSQIDDNSEVWEEGQTGDLVINQWFAEKEGLV